MNGALALEGSLFQTGPLPTGAGQETGVTKARRALQKQSGHPVGGMPVRCVSVPCSLLPVPALPPVVGSAHHVIGPVVHRRIRIRIGCVTVVGRSVGAAPVEARAAGIETLRQPCRLLRAHGINRERRLMWKVTSASAGIQTLGPGEAAEAAVPAATPAPAPMAQPTPRPTAQPMMVPRMPPPMALPTVSPALFGPFTLNWSLASG